MFLVVVFDFLMANFIVAFLGLSVYNLSIRLLSGKLYYRTSLAADIKALQVLDIAVANSMAAVHSEL